MSRTQRIILLILLPVVVVGAVLIGRAVRPGDDGGAAIGVENADGVRSFDYEYVIPEGAADRIEAGEQVDIVPRELTVRVGESIRIVNDDRAGHVVGVFYVGAGETLTKRFTSPGELSGSCTVHSDGEFTLIVEA